MKTALLLIACWLLALIPLDQGLTPLVTLLFNPDRALYGTAQLTGFAGILLTLYLANLGVEVVLRRRFQIAGMLALLAAWTDSSTAAAPRATGWCSTPWRCRFIWWAGWYLFAGSRRLAARKADISLISHPSHTFFLS
jgi:hypothetical protein